MNTRSTLSGGRSMERASPSRMSARMGRTSNPIASRSRLLATSRVVPPPQKGSSTVSPGCV